MKYIDWLKRQIKLSQFKNVIRFPSEKRLNQIEEEKKKNLVKKVDKPGKTIWPIF
tara:strand:+ start:875 stop:1039 length:165 start_codon:yes stop_codon:yes gene_type:complete